MNRIAVIAERESDRDTLPLFPDLPPCPQHFERNASAVFDDPFLAELALTAPLQRLKQIGFLGALDYVRSSNGFQSHRRRHNRYEHSVGVAELALLYADIRSLSRRETRVLAAAGLLHDIGHGPLSHTLEPIFKSEFDITHHRSGDDILYGRSPFGSEIIEIMSAYGIDLDEVAAMIEGRHDGEHSYLFSSPINLDTIEGISRSRVFAAKSHGIVDPRRLVVALAETEELPTALMDEFWSMKHEVYNLVIHNTWGLIFDGLAQAYMHHNIEKFSSEDFLKTEDQLRHKQPTLFHIFAWAKASKRRAYHRVSEMVPEVLGFSLRAPKREFTVKSDIQVYRPSDIARRYQQQKSFRNITIGQLVTSQKETKVIYA